MLLITADKCKGQDHPSATHHFRVLQPVTAAPSRQNNNQTDNKSDTKTESKGQAESLREFIKSETTVMEE